MKLLHQIQANLLDETASVGSALLKLRLLAARLGSDPLEDWVRQETEGYTENTNLPEYRSFRITYSGTFTNGYQTLNDSPIPLQLIRRLAGDSWASYNFRGGMAVVDEAVRRGKDQKGTTFQIDCGDLMPQLTNKVYKDFICSHVKGLFDFSAFVRVQSIVRAKALDLCIKIERELPAAVEIALGPPTFVVDRVTSEQVGHIFNQTFNGPFTSINSSGIATIQIGVTMGDQSSLTKALIDEGVDESDANDLTKIVASETPLSKDEPFGVRAEAWFEKRAKVSLGGIWKFGADVAKDVIKQYVKQYYFGI